MDKTAVTNSTLVDLLRYRAQEQADRHAYSFLYEDDTEERVTYQELDVRARTLAVRLQQSEVHGERVLLLYQPSMDYLVAFFGCLYAGAVPVPAYPPRLNGNLSRLQAVVADAQAKMALTTETILSGIERRFGESEHLAGLEWIATDELADGMEDQWQAPAITSESLCFLQYTSGSTSLPKGVMLSHGNLLHNLEVIQNGFTTTPESVGVIWLPPYHDMGLIGGILQPLYTGYPVTLMAPVDFITRPLRWLETISRVGATVSGGPNFAYDLCVQKITPEQRDQLDLSKWEHAFSGAEPIRHESLERFAEYFAPTGFRKESFYPCYGLAEGTLFVSGGLKEAPPVVRTFQGESLEQNKAILATEESENNRVLVSSGRPELTDQKVVIASLEGFTTCPEEQIGEIWVKGQSVAQGYWRRKEQTEETFHAYLKDTGEGPFLRTGDLGFIQDGELYVTGRLKDLIIIRGRNYYPQDIEFSVQESHPAVNNGNGAAFALEIDGEERLVIVQELERKFRKGNHEEVVEAIRRAISEQHQLQVHAVVLIKPASVPKTSSGKIQRHACKDKFLNGGLDVIFQDGRGSNAEATDELEETVEAGTGLDREALLALAEGERAPVLTDDLMTKAAHVLRLSLSQLDAERSLSTYGLDSLMAVDLKNRVEESFGVQLPMVLFLEGASVQTIARTVLEQLANGEVHVTEVIVSGGAEDKVLPLSYGQRSLWFLYQLAPESSAYNVAKAVRIEEEIDLQALRQAFALLVERHPQLRTTFSWQNGSPVQLVHDGSAVELIVHDASAWTESGLSESINDQAWQPFDLEKGPLMRVHLFSQSTKSHVLLLSVHHILVDFWSLGVLVSELRQSYAVLKKGQPVTLTAPARTYGDYAKQQSALLASSRGDALWEYWRTQLEDAPTVLNLPTDKPRPTLQSHRGASHSFRLGQALSREVQSLSKEQGATLYMTLLAAFQVLLYRYTGQEDILVGSPTAGRTSMHDANVIGYYVNPVVLRADLAGAPTFLEFLGQVRQTVLNALQHQEYPFPLLVERLQPQRDLSYPPLIQVMFALQKSHQLDSEGLSGFALNEDGVKMSGELGFQSMRIEQPFVQFDLNLSMAEQDGQLVATFEYNTDLFEAATIQRMTGHFETLLQSIVDHLDLPVSQLSMLPDQERHQLLVERNDNHVDYPQGELMHQNFERQAERTPDQVAIIDGERRVTYRELNERANQVAHRLQALGVGPEVFVGVCMTRSLEMITVMLGILKAGGAYVPMDPNYPQERIGFMLEDTEAPILLSQSDLLHILPEHRAQVLCMDLDQAAFDQEPVTNPVRETTERNLAYVIYTSGSTGKPKGVAIEHRNAATFIQWARGVFTDQELAGVLFSTSICFDLSVFELFVTLAWGGRVVVAENALQLPELPAREEVTLINTVPSAITELLRMDGIPASVRTVNLAGEPLKQVIVDKLYEIKTIERVYNLYGPSEDTTYSTFARMTANSNRLPTIGRALSNTQVYLLDRHMQPVPFGVPGELHLGGAGLSRGYLKRPDLTAEKFIANPFVDDPEARLYKTGDLVRYLPDGNLDYIGRLDHQVKVRGFRIELGEIDARLVKHDSVQESLVIVREDVPGDQRIVAYLVPAAGVEVSTNELRRYMQDQVPEYMVPSHFVVLPTLPLNSSGKVDRKALPAPDKSQRESGAAYIAPTTELERKITEIWQGVLRIENIGIHDNFFELGGHSLLMAQVHRGLQEVTERKVTVVDLFRHPTIAALAQYLNQGSEKVSMEQVRDQANKKRDALNRRKALHKDRRN